MLNFHENLFFRLSDVKSHAIIAIPIFGNSNNSPVDIVSRTKCKILFLEKEKLLECMQENKEFLKNFLDEISNKSQFLSKKIWFNFVNKSIEDKLIDYINNKDENIIKLAKAIAKNKNKILDRLNEEMNKTDNTDIDTSTTPPDDSNKDENKEEDMSTILDGKDEDEASLEE